MAFDLDRFRKVRALAEDASTTVGERAAARSRLEKMAARAGIDVATAEALASEEAHQAGSWQAQWAREQRKDEAHFQEAVRRYGPAEQVFAETERECRLREGLERLAVRRTYSNSPETYIAGFFDWLGGRDLSPVVLAALDLTEPLPGTISEVLTEWQQWRDLIDRRLAYFRDYDPPTHVRCREAALEWLIGALPARSWGDFDQRLAWCRERLEEGEWYTAKDHADLLKRIGDDISSLRNARVPRRSRKSADDPDQLELL